MPAWDGRGCVQRRLRGRSGEDEGVDPGGAEELVQIGFVVVNVS